MGNVSSETYGQMAYNIVNKLIASGMTVPIIADLCIEEMLKESFESFVHASLRATDDLYKPPPADIRSAWCVAAERFMAVAQPAHESWEQPLAALAEIISVAKLTGEPPKFAPDYLTTDKVEKMMHSIDHMQRFHIDESIEQHKP